MCGSRWLPCLAITLPLSPSIFHTLNTTAKLAFELFQHIFILLRFSTRSSVNQRMPCSHLNKLDFSRSNGNPATTHVDSN